MRELLVAALIILPAAATAQPAGVSEPKLAAALHSLKPAGAPRSCVTLHDVPETKVLDGGAIIFRHDSGHAYVNRLRGACPALTRNRAFSSRSSTDRLCSGDIIGFSEPVSGADFGSCVLGDFEPYGR